jgi:hypothetical protein
MGLVATLALASILLAFAASLPAVPAPAVRRGAVAYLAAVIAGAALVSVVVARQPWMVPGKVSPVAKYGIQQLKAPAEKNVLVLDGASYVLNGVDVLVVADELEQLGYSARAVKLAFGGANHFERFKLYEDIVSRIPKRQREGQHWVYLAEVMGGYDREPLNQLKDNPDSARAFHYLTPTNAWYAGLAMRSEHVTERFEGWQWLIARHAMVNAFNAGVLSRVVPEEEIEPVTGLASKGAKRFKYDFEALLKEAREPSPPVPIPTWMFTIREPRERALWVDRFRADWVYFGVPSTRPEQLRYIRSFCAATKAPCIKPDEDLIRELEAPTNWRNAGHMNRNGALIYSRWLAREVARLGVLKK